MGSAARAMQDLCQRVLMCLQTKVSTSDQRSNFPHQIGEINLNTYLIGKGIRRKNEYRNELVGGREARVNQK